MSEPTQDSPQEQAQERAHLRRNRWVRECAVIAASYAINGFFISAFALTDTVSWLAGAVYMLPGIAACALIAYWIATQRSARFKDASMSAFHTCVCISLCLLGVSLFPQVAFAYALLLFTCLLTATYRSPKRWVHGALVATALLFGLLTLGLGRPLQLPNRNTGEQFITWLFFVVTLGRCVMLSVITTGNLLLLRQRSEKMAETLAEIERLAHHDELTGVLNRRHLLKILSDEMARTDRMQTPLSVALFDLDHFKAINDTQGHLAGDRVLQRFASAVQALSRNTDRFGRYGGEEFLLILTNVDPTQAELAIDRIRAALAPTDWHSIAPSLNVTFSAGLARYTPGDSCEQLINRADQALYAAKHAGRNCTRAA